MAQISFERLFIVIVAQVSMWPHGPLLHNLALTQTHQSPELKEGH